MNDSLSGSELSRRGFLGHSAAVAAGVIAAGALASAASGAEPAPASVPATAPARRPWKKAVMYSMIEGNGSVLEKFKLLKACGFDGVELNSPGMHVDEVIAARDATGLLIEGVVDSAHWTIPLSDPDPKRRAAAVESLKTALRECKAYGGTSVLLVPAVVNKRVSYADAYTRSQEEIRKVLPVAEETGIKIAIENVWNQFLLSPLEAARYVDEFQSPWVGWHFDIGNVINYGWPEQWIKILGKRILKIHIKEYSRAKRDNEGLRKGFDVDLLDGDDDWPTVMKALDEVGYGTSSGWGCAEVRGGGEARLREISSRLDRIFAS